MEASLPVTMKYIYFICRFSPAPRNVDWKLKARARSAIHSEITSYSEKTQNTNHIAWTRMIVTRDRLHQQTRSPVGGRIAIRLAWFSERKPTQLNLECHLGTRNHLKGNGPRAVFHHPPRDLPDIRTTFSDKFVAMTNLKQLHQRPY